jgi:hypothetical protein
MWDRQVVEKTQDCVGNFLVACSFRSVIDNVERVFAGVYGPADDVERRYLWEELVGIMSWWELSWCIEGDLNVVHFPCEKSGDSRQSTANVEVFGVYVGPRTHGHPTCRWEFCLV